MFENSYGSNGDRFAIAVRNTAWENSEIPSCSAMMLCRSVVHSLLPFITVLASLFEIGSKSTLAAGACSTKLRSKTMVRDVESKINDEVQPDRGKLLIIFESCDRIINRVISS